MIVHINEIAADNDQIRIQFIYLICNAADMLRAHKSAKMNVTEQYDPAGGFLRAKLYGIGCPFDVSGVQISQCHGQRRKQITAKHTCCLCRFRKRKELGGYLPDEYDEKIINEIIDGKIKRKRTSICRISEFWTIHFKMPEIWTDHLDLSIVVPDGSN